MLNICKQLFDSWNDKNVRYCHWKSNEHLMEGLDGDTDLDVYVLPQDKGLVESLLLELSYLKCVTQIGCRYPNVFEWLGFDKDTGKLVHVHLHYQIITGTKYCKEYVFPLDDLILSSRVLDPITNVYITDPNLEIIILYCRIALKAKNKKSIRVEGSDKREIDFLKSQIQENKVACLCNQLIGNEGYDFYALLGKTKLSSNDWYRIYLIAEKWLNPYRKYSKLHVFLRHQYYNIRHLLVHIAITKFNWRIINKKTLPNKSLSICFLGQDGSGKSTVTIELCKWLSWKLSAHRFYLGSGDHYKGVLNRLILKGSKIKRKQSSTRVPEDDQKIQRKKKKYSLKNFFSETLSAVNRLTIARNAYKEVLRAEKYRKKGGIPLFDRFPQLQFEGIYDGPKIAESYRKNGLDYTIVRIMAKIEYRYIEKIQNYQPGLIFKLLLSPEESIRRKPHESLSVVARKHEITKQLQFPNSLVFTIDATQDYQQELLYIKNIIWKSIIENQ